MKKLSANSWVLIILTLVIAVIGIEATRKALAGDKVAADPGAPPEKIKVGEVAPDFTLPDHTGKDKSFSELVAAPTMLTFSCGCSSCRTMETYLGKLQKAKKDLPPVVTVTSADPVAHKAWVRDTELKGEMLYDGSGTPVMEMYEGHPCPRIYLLDGQRKVTWKSKSLSEYPMPELGMEEMSRDITRLLGFSTPDKPDPNKPPAPEMIIDQSRPAGDGSGERVHPVSTDPEDPLPAALVKQMQERAEREKQMRLKADPAPPKTQPIAPYAGTGNASPFDTPAAPPSLPK